MAEHRTLDPDVAGSSPAPPATFHLIRDTNTPRPGRRNRDSSTDCQHRHRAAAQRRGQVGPGDLAHSRDHVRVGRQGDPRVLPEKLHNDMHPRTRPFERSGSGASESWWSLSSAEPHRTATTEVQRPRGPASRRSNRIHTKLERRGAASETGTAQRLCPVIVGRDAELHAFRWAMTVAMAGEDQMHFARR